MAVRLSSVCKRVELIKIRINTCGMHGIDGMLWRAMTCGGMM
jgi:hypothetical protein